MCILVNIYYSYYNLPIILHLPVRIHLDSQPSDAGDIHRQRTCPQWSQQTSSYFRSIITKAVNRYDQRRLLRL